jgi:hypothetical protein
MEVHGTRIMAVVGYNTIGGTNEVFLFGSGMLTKFTPTEDGDISDLVAYISDNSGPNPSNVATMAVFRMSDNVLKCYSNELGSFALSGSWRTFSTLTEVATDGLKIFNGEEIGIALWTNNIGAVRTFSDASTGQSSERTNNQTYPTWTSPWSEVGVKDIKMSVYLNYTPSGGADETKFFFGVQ